MYSPLFLSTPSPRPSPSFASAEWGPSHAVPPVGSPREHRRAWPLGTVFPLGALASPPSSCGLAPHRHAPPALISRAPRPGGSVVRPATLELYHGALEGCDAATIPRRPFPQGPNRMCLCPRACSISLSLPPVALPHAVIPPCRDATMQYLYHLFHSCIVSSGAIPSVYPYLYEVPLSGCLSLRTWYLLPIPTL